MRNGTVWMTGIGIGSAGPRCLLLLAAMAAVGILAAACDGAGPQSPAATIPPDAPAVTPSATPNLEATVAALVATALPTPELRAN